MSSFSNQTITCMKTYAKFSFISFVLLSIIIVMSSHTSNRKKIPEICHSCKTDSFLGVPLDTFMKDVGRYRGTHVEDAGIGMARSTNKHEKDMSRACTYSLDTLKKFICLLETYAAKSKIRSKDLAIRFYYGVYPREMRIARQDYGSLHTLFMVPAVYNPKTEVYEDFDAKASAQKRYQGKGNGKMEYQFKSGYYTLREMVAQGISDPIFILDASAILPPRGEVRGLAPPPAFVMNQGQLCPPNCPDDSFLSKIDQKYGRTSY